MTPALVLLAAVTIALPREGQRLPPISRCYMIGAVDDGLTNLVVQGRNVPVHRSGAWATLLDVAPGENVVEAGGCRRSFRVEAPRVPRPKPSEAAKPAAANVQPKAAAPAKTYPKLPYAGDVAKPHPAGREPSAVTIVLDPGHGGADTGALSPHGRGEKDANLRLAKAVAQELRNRGYRVVMTRDDDSPLALYDRPKVAHREDADAFVSIHHNAPPFDRDPNRLRYHAVYAWNPIGDCLAKAINRRMAEASPLLTNNGVMHANFAVTRNPEIPSCLIEADFITSPDGEEAAWDPVRIAANATAIAAGIADWAMR